MTARVLLLLAILIVAGACASMRRPAGQTGDRNTLAASQIDAALHPNAYAAIRALRPHWLEVRGSAAARGNTAKRVYLDDMFLGGVDLLLRIAMSTVESMEHLDGPAATQRWGMDHAAGVILIHSRR